MAAIKTKIEGFTLSNGIVDYLNTKSFYSKGGLMIYLKIQEESQKIAQAGIGELSIRKLMEEVNLTVEEVIRSLNNLSEINFATFNLSDNKNFINEKCLNIFSSKNTSDKLIGNFLLNNDNNDPYVSAVKFFNEIPLNKFINYLDLLFIPNMKFKYKIIKYKDGAIIRQKKHFDKEMYRILNRFKSRRVFENNNWDLVGGNWEILNLVRIRTMIEELRGKFPLSEDGFIVKLVYDMIDYCLSEPYFNGITGGLRVVHLNNNEIIKKVKDLREIIKILEENKAMKEKMERIQIEIQNKLKVKLSPSHCRFFPLYFYKVINLDIKSLNRAIDFISRCKDHDVNNINLKLVSKQIMDNYKANR